MRSFMMVPKTITPEVTALARECVATPLFSYVDVQPRTDAALNDCFRIVERQVAEYGGSAQLGWKVFEWPGLFIEAVFHAVWRKPDGSLLDLTPEREGQKKVLFFEDPGRRYEGKQVNNIRRGLSDDPAVAKYLHGFDREFEIANLGDRAEQHGAIELTEAEADEMARLTAERVRLHDRLVALTPQPRRNGPCPCGSARKYKKCCGAP